MYTSLYENVSVAVASVEIDLPERRQFFIFSLGKWLSKEEARRVGFFAGASLFCYEYM